jgi:hypothetical protein
MATDKDPDQTATQTRAAPAAATAATTAAVVTEAAEGKNGGKVRSETPYPYFGLSKVIDIVKAVQRVSGNAPAPAAALLTDLGISKTDRLWAYGIPAATYFGLVERIGRGEDAQVKLTELGRRIALPGTPDEERATKASAVKNPELYMKLLEQFAGAPVPSKDALKRILQRDYKIVESMAGGAADAFLDSLTAADVIAPNGVIAFDSQPRVDEKDIKPPADVPPPPTAGMQNVEVPDTFVVYTCKFGKGRFIKIPLPRDFTGADVDRLYAFLKTQVDDEPIQAKP